MDPREPPGPSGSLKLGTLGKLRPPASPPPSLAASPERAPWEAARSQTARGLVFEDKPSPLRFSLKNAMSDPAARSLATP